MSRGTIGDLTQQLALSHVAREDGAYRAARFHLYMYLSLCFADLFLSQIRTMEELGSHSQRFNGPVRSSKDDLTAWISATAISVPSSSRQHRDEWAGYHA